MAEDIWDAWIVALNSRQHEALERAVHPGVALEVYGVDAQRAIKVQTLRGQAEVFAWIQRAPGAACFARAADASGDRLEARYSVRVLYFHGGGLWRGELADDGRLARVEHRPDDLAAEFRGGAPGSGTG